jgi:hypothetical protein
VEEDFRAGKDCLGLDQCQARLYTAIQRHVVLVMAARNHPEGHAFRWLAWRRRHQARSRWFHQRTALTANTPWSASNWRLPYQFAGRPGGGPDMAATLN